MRKNSEKRGIGCDFGLEAVETITPHLVKFGDALNTGVSSFNTFTEKVSNNMSAFNKPRLTSRRDFCSMHSIGSELALQFSQKNVFAIAIVVLVSLYSAWLVNGIVNALISSITLRFVFTILLIMLICICYALKKKDDLTL
jgi:hypothetical protein